MLRSVLNCKTITGRMLRELAFRQAMTQRDFMGGFMARSRALGKRKSKFSSSFWCTFGRLTRDSVNHPLRVIFKSSYDPGSMLQWDRAPIATLVATLDRATLLRLEADLDRLVCANDATDADAEWLRLARLALAN